MPCRSCWRGFCLPLPPPCLLLRRCRSSSPSCTAVDLVRLFAAACCCIPGSQRANVVPGCTFALPPDAAGRAVTGRGSAPFALTCCWRASLVAPAQHAMPPVADCGSEQPPLDLPRRRTAGTLPCSAFNYCCLQRDKLTRLPDNHSCGICCYTIALLVRVPVATPGAWFVPLPCCRRTATAIGFCCSCPHLRQRAAA